MKREARTRTPAAAGAALPAGDEPLAGEPLGDVLFGDLGADEPMPGLPDGFVFGASTVSTEIAAAVGRRTARAQRAAIAVAIAALLVAVAGLAAARGLLSQGPEAAFAAHVEAADRLVAEGRLVGKDGALEHLLAASRLRPDDAALAARLSRLADLLEALAARALERGDAAVASVHLGWAARAAPERPSIRAAQERLARRAAPGR
jgi:hypothetical protein